MPTGEGKYIPRIVDKEITDALRTEPVVMIVGARGVGKTTSIEERQVKRINLDNREMLQLMTENPEQLLRYDGKPVFIDEWQRHGGTLDIVHKMVKDNPTPGRFILTGSTPSASRKDYNRASSMVNINMRPMSLLERWTDRAQPSVSIANLLEGGGVASISGDTAIKLPDYLDEMVRGGFPGMRGGDIGKVAARIDSYNKNMVNKDIPKESGLQYSPKTFSNFLVSYASYTGTNATMDRIFETACKNNVPKDMFESCNEIVKILHLAEPVPGWTTSLNLRKQVEQREKHFFLDPALPISLLGLTYEELTRGNIPHPLDKNKDGKWKPFLGLLFESLISPSLQTYTQANGAKLFHYREKSGSEEVDFIAKSKGGLLLAIEVKLAESPKSSDFKHLLEFKKEMGDDCVDTIMITTGQKAYREDNGVAIVPAALLGLSPPTNCFSF